MPFFTTGMTPEQIKKFHLLILKELGLEGLPPTTQESILAEVGQNIFMNIQLETMKKLPRELHPDYTRLIEAGKSEEATKLLEKHIPNLDKFVSDVAAATVKEFKALAAAA